MLRLSFQDMVDMMSIVKVPTRVTALYIHDR